MARASFSAYAAAAFLVMAVALGLYEITVAFLIEDANFGRANFGMLSIVSAHIAVARAEAEARSRR